jgi:phenylalanyl-tRNA synthetase beta chain
MRVPLSWLREHVEVPVEPARLAEDLTLAGLAVDAIEQHGDDVVLDIDVTTNRVDCMNVRGVAREVGVLYRRPLLPLALDFTERGEPAHTALRVEIDAPELCPRFCARVLYVRLGPSPDWMQRRLDLVGVRPINNIVDLSNYVMMELGHPSHAFDLAKVPQGLLRVRWAAEGEKLTTLDGQERTLGSRIGVVAGPDAPLALAGVMGGASSEVTERTGTVALEAAYWDPLTIRRVSRALALHSEASHRFSRGADPEGPLPAISRIAHLLEKLGAGSVRPGVIDVHPAPRPARSSVLRERRVTALLGVAVPAADSQRILEGLGFEVSGGPDLQVGVPSWRGDVSREIDLVEEVARHTLQRVPSTVPAGRSAEGLRPRQVRDRKVREVLAGAGLTEVISLPFCAEAHAPGGPALANPLAADEGRLRTSLVLPGLLRALQANLRAGRRDLAIHELGRVFVGGGEELRLGILLAGHAPSHWSARPRPFDFFDVKGLLELLAARLGFQASFERSEEGLLHPGQSALVRVGGEVAGHLGALHPEVAREWDLPAVPLVAELRVEALCGDARPMPRFASLPRFPSVTRDLAVVVPGERTAAEVEALVRGADAAGLVRVAVVDRYVGAPIPEGQASLTVALSFQDPERTLTGDEVQAQVTRIVDSLRSQGLEIRGE